MLMSMPVVGGVLEPKDWGEVPVHVMVFLTAAIPLPHQHIQVVEGQAVVPRHAEIHDSNDRQGVFQLNG